MPTGEPSRAEHRRLLTVSETAQSLQLSKPTIYRLIRTADLSVVRVGRAVRISVASVDEWIARNIAEQVTG